MQFIQRNILQRLIAQIIFPEYVTDVAWSVYNEGVSITKDFLSSGLSNGTSAEWAVTGQSQNTCRGGPVINQPHPFCTATMESTSEDNLLT